MSDFDVGNVEIADVGKADLRGGEAPLFSFFIVGGGGG